MLLENELASLAREGSGVTPGPARLLRKALWWLRGLPCFQGSTLGGEVLGGECRRDCLNHGGDRSLQDALGETRQGRGLGGKASHGQEGKRDTAEVGLPMPAPRFHLGSDITLQQGTPAVQNSHVIA